MGYRSAEGSHRKQHASHQKGDQRCLPCPQSCRCRPLYQCGTEEVGRCWYRSPDKGLVQAVRKGHQEASRQEEDRSQEDHRQEDRSQEEASCQEDHRQEDRSQEEASCQEEDQGEEISLSTQLKGVLIQTEVEHIAPSPAFFFKAPCIAV